MPKAEKGTFADIWITLIKESPDEAGEIYLIPGDYRNDHK